MALNREIIENYGHGTRGSLVCRMTGAMFVEARAATHQRSPIVNDDIQSLGQVPFRGAAPWWSSPLKEVFVLFVVLFVSPT